MGGTRIQQGTEHKSNFHWLPTAQGGNTHQHQCHYTAPLCRVHRRLQKDSLWQTNWYSQDKGCTAPLSHNSQTGKVCRKLGWQSPKWRLYHWGKANKSKRQRQW